MPSEAESGRRSAPLLLEDVWQCAGPSRSVRPGRMRGLILAGHPVLLARQTDGNVFAVRDLCPHRGVPLSGGRFDGREVECAYHGWRFGADGRCTHIPSLVSGQDFAVDRVRTHRWPVHEAQGLIWIHLGPSEPDHAAPMVPDFPAHSRPSLLLEMILDTDVDQAAIGLLDPAHGPFVHRSWFWRSGRSLHEKAKRMAPTDLGFAMLRHTPSGNTFAYRLLGGRPETEITFRLPGVRIEHIRIGRHRVCGLTAVTPIDDNSTRILHAMWWTTPWLTALKPVLRVLAHRFLSQDRRMSRLQRKGLIHNPQMMLIRDADTQARWYHQLKDELVRSRAENRPFRNPVQETTLRWRT